MDDNLYEFDSEDFASNHNGKKIKNGRRKSISHFIILGIAIIIIIFAVVKVVKWNKGIKSDYDPTEDTSEFDVEPSDYIQPLSGEQLSEKQDDGVTTILTLGNSPFSDNYKNNNLAKALGDEYGANVINVGFENSYITQSQAEYSEDKPEDGVSLYQVALALSTGDFSVVSESAEKLGEDAQISAATLKSVDMTKVDAIFIMYNLEDYRDHRPLGSEDKEDVTCIYGAIYSALEKIQEAYPYIRIVMLSQPAGGVTIDNFFVDGELHDIGEGTLADYITFETSAAASRGVSFVDIYYGAINIDVRKKYLVNDYHINDDGAKAIAKRVKTLIELQ